MTLPRQYDGSDELMGLLYRAMEHGLSHRSDGLLVPFAILVVGAQRELTRFVGHPYSEAVEHARRHVVGARFATSRWAVAYDGVAHFPDGTTSAVIVEGGEQGGEHAYRLVQRYEAPSDGKMLLVGLPEYTGWADQLLDRPGVHLD